MGSASKDLGIYTVSLLIEFIAFIVSFFSTDTSGALSTNGFNNWSNFHTRLCEHECSKSHLETTWRFLELHQRLCSVQTINEKHEIIINEHAKHWQQEFKRLVAIVQFLGKV